MRLEGQSKLGYYPTPEQTLNYTKTWLTLTSDDYRRFLDPCCGKGEALAAIAGGQAETYGIELSDVRASAAASRDTLTHVLNTAYEYAVLTPETFSLILLNPPYDGENTTGGGKRMEETFLCDLPTTDALVPGGALIYIIPHTRINERIARHLAGWYTGLRCFKLPAGEYEVFKQVVIFALKHPDYHAPDGDTLKGVLAWRDGQQITDWTVEETPELLPTADADGKQKAKKVRKPILGDLPELAAGHGEYIIPPTPLKGKGGRPFRFQYNAVSDEDFRREAEDCAARLDTSRDWRELPPPLEPSVIEPAMTPKKGHISMQVTGGLLGTNRVADPDGKAMLLKGNVSKVVIRKQDDLEAEAETWDEGEDDDKKSLRKVEVEERFLTLLSTLSEDGTLITHNDPADIAPILERYVGQLAEIVQARNVPQYDMQPAPWEWTVFDPLSKGRQLPGRSETGLTDFQRHLSIALGRLCLKHGTGFINAEMGSGKTTCGIAIAEYLRVSDARRGKAQTAYPALVVGPGIVTGAENWPKEIPEVTPGAAGRVVVVGAKPLPKPIKIGAYLKGLGLTLKEADFEGKSATACLSALKREAKKQKIALSDMLVAALKESLERSEKSLPVRRRGAKSPNLLDGRIGGFGWLGLGVPRDPNSEDDLKGKYSLAQFIVEYQAGALPEKSFAIVSYETAKLGSGRVPAMTTRHVRVRWTDDNDRRRSEIRAVCACPTCGRIVAREYDEEDGAPLDMITPGRSAEEFIGLKRRYCQVPAPKWVWDADKGKHVVKTHDEDGHPCVCGAPLFENSALRRIPAAEYAKKKAKGVFGLCLVDEVHKAKAKGTGVGFALTAIVHAARYTVGLTGTLFGGYSTSIFWLLYRLTGEVREQFDFNDERRWVEKYGLLKRTFYVDQRAFVADDGAFTGTKFFETVSEKPGISPAIAGLGLKYCTFSSLKDVGLPLPLYGEQIVRIPMTGAMEAQYADADGSGKPPTGLFKWALNTMEEETGKGAISVWLNTALNRPDAMFRAEQVFFNRRLAGRGKYAVRQREQVTEFDPVIGEGAWLPKEMWTAGCVLDEYRQGRKTLVYVRQTGERDVQERLKACLAARGLRVGILRPTIAPDKRATWIKRHVGEFDVLLSNARLVEVGLNLTMFSTAIFFELEWSLYVLWQSMRRLYRPGAPKPVQLYFPVYEGTLEEAALDLIGAKMLAAQVFYGDEVGGALVEEGDEGNLLNDIVRRAMGELKVGRAEGIFSMSAEADMTEAALESPTAINNPQAVTLADLWARRREIRRAGKSQRRPDTDGTVQQMKLF